MPVSRQQKVIIFFLISYWLTLFISAHIPIPQVIREADISDKGLHTLAYLILTFLLCSTINPNKKVNWRKASAWWILLVVVLYGICDEVLQLFVAGRTCDARDFLADLGGTLSALIVLSFFTFWPAFLVVTGVSIFTLTNIARVNIANLFPMLDTAFHLFVYAFFTLLWIQNLHYLTKLTAPKPKWLIAALMVPVIFLLAVKSISITFGRSYTTTDIYAAAAGIVAVVGITSIAALIRQKLARTEKYSSAD